MEHHQAKPGRITRWILPLVVIAALIVAAHTPDLPAAVLVAKYAPPPSRFVTLDSGARVHYRDQGRKESPALLLLHGSNSSLYAWEPWVPLLSDAIRVVTLDLPGHGLTGPVPGDDYSPDGMVRFVDAFAKKLGLVHFYLGGNSMGGNVAFRYALAHPEKVDKLVLLDSGGLTHLLPKDHQPVLPIGFKLMRTPGVNVVAGFFTPRSVVEKSTRSVFVDQTKVTTEMVDWYYELLLYPGNRRATRLRASAPVDTTAADRLGEIRCPTLILWGGADTLAPVEEGRLFHARIPGSLLLEYPNVGHLPMEEIPERSALDVRAFLLPHE